MKGGAIMNRETRKEMDIEGVAILGEETRSE